MGQRPRSSCVSLPFLFSKYFLFIIAFITVIQLPILYVYFMTKAVWDFQNTDSDTNITVAWTNETLTWHSRDGLACTLPYQHDFEETIAPYFVNHTNLNCKQVQCQLSYLKNGYLYIDSSALEKCYANNWKDVHCAYRYLDGSLGKTANTVDYTTFVPINASTPVKVTSTYIDVQCKLGSQPSPNDTSWLYRDTHAFFVSTTDKLYKSENENLLSLHILMLDSLAYTMFRRYMPLSNAYMKNAMQSFAFRGYLKNGDNSMPNLVALLGGKIYNNQSDAMPSDFWEEYVPATPIRVDNEFQPWLWKQFQDNGCVTFMNDDVVHHTRGAFSYPTTVVTGFTKKPTDFYLRPFWVNVRKYPIANSSTYCYGNRAAHQLQLNLTENFMVAFRNACQFTLTHFAEIAHDWPGDIGFMDKEFSQYLQRMYTGGYWNNSVVVIMGDHGPRMSYQRELMAGKIEERRPLFTITFPPWFLQKYSLEVKTMRANEHRITSHFDAHATLVALATNAISGFKNTTHGTSLFQLIPLDRTCTEASVPEQHCLCLEKPFNLTLAAPPTRGIVSAACTAIVGRLNAYVMNYLPAVCSTFSVAKIFDVRELSVNELVYYGCRYFYRECYQGFGEWTADLLFYKLKIALEPGGWSVETIVQFSPALNLLRSMNPLILSDKSNKERRDRNCPDDIACFCDYTETTQ